MSKAAVKTSNNDCVAWVFIALLGITTLGYGFQALSALGNMLGQPGPLVPFGLGAVCAGAFYWRKSRGTWDVLEHEITHGLFSVLGGNKVTRIVAGDEAFKPEFAKSETGYLGYCQSSGKHTGILARCHILGPYFFPTYTIGLFLIRLLLSEPVPWAFDLILGATFGYHFSSHLKQIPNAVRVAKKDESGEHDFARFGVTYSLAFVILANMVVVPSIIIAVHSGFFAMVRYYMAGQDFWIDWIIGA